MPQTVHFRYSATEVDKLLKILKKVKPVETMGWEKVQRKFVRAFPGRERNVDSLKQKFKDSRTVPMPKGDAKVPNDNYKGNKQTIDVDNEGKDINNDARSEKEGADANTVEFLLTQYEH